jgi:hypothetical protein
MNRLAIVETHVVHLIGQSADLRADLRTLSTKVDDDVRTLSSKIDNDFRTLSSKIDNDFRTLSSKIDNVVVLLAGMNIASTLGLAALMAKGFHWF